MSESISKTKQVLLNSREIEVPVNWDVVTIGDVAQKTKGKKPGSLYEEPDSDRLPYLTISASQGEVSQWADSDDGKRVSDSQILMVWDGASSGTVFKSSEGMIGSTLAAFKFEDSTFDNEFAYYFLSHFEDRISELTEGTGIPHVPRDFTHVFQVLAPPLSEQHRIAEIISTVDEQIQQTDEIIENARELKRGLMSDLLHKGIGHSEFKEMYIGPKRSTIPAEWEVVSLDEIADIQSGSTPKRGNEDYWKNGTIPWVKSGEFNDRVIKDVEEKITEKALDETGCTVFPQGTLLIALYGKGTVSKTARLGMDAATNQAIAGLLPKNGSFDPRYLQYYLIDSRNTLLNVTVNPSSDTGRTNIYLSALRKFKVPLPPIEEQQAIADRIASVDDKIADEKETKQHYQELKRGLMQDLLTGKVRVATD